MAISGLGWSSSSRGVESCWPPSTAPASAGTCSPAGPCPAIPGSALSVNVFHPDRLALVKAAPAHRRAHLDRLCGAIWPARADLRRRFGRTLAQRNALVARVRAGSGGAESLASWDERLAAEAEPLIAARADAVDTLAEPFSELGKVFVSASTGPRSPIGHGPRAMQPSSPPSWRGAARRTWGAPIPPTGHSWTRSSCVSGVGSYGASLPRASNGWRCSRCSSRSARRCSRAGDRRR